MGNLDGLHGDCKRVGGTLTGFFFEGWGTGNASKTYAAPIKVSPIDTLSRKVGNLACICALFKRGRIISSELWPATMDAV